MAKLFRDIFEAEEFQFENVNGEIKTVKTQFISSGQQQAFLKKSKEYNEKVKNKEFVDPYEMIFEAMKMRFGQDDAFWGQFRIELLNEASEYFIDELKKKSTVKTG
jgi:NADPH-dependent glutamate synthase beta subunit-like oxidoreductase